MSSLIFMVVLFSLLHCPLPSLSNSEGEALYAFKERLDDPRNALESWDPTLVDPCTWFHVTCDSSNHVIRLEFNGNYIGGNIPEELGNLGSLVSMDLSNNRLEGNIPKSFGNLTSLKFLNVSNNHLTLPPVNNNFQTFPMESYENNKFRGWDLRRLIPDDS
ncbi:hypothetical protein VNO78_07448 [Psophocarpus tetragonolobus]|uniref:Leucine-rich repeat-containing N-terminal plant-type domain-containing protein n=1 Tax=Psophocarpus tetragonolobus TaxID=3891 RepID=A0AAN9STA6_PSOTE